VRWQVGSIDDDGDDMEDEAQSKSWSDEWSVVLIDPPAAGG
jgi:hypothetical protein